jgi:vacuolar protein sorting-associated protein IST1
MQAEQLIEEDNMLEAFDIIELYCNRLIEHAKQLDKPQYASSLHPNI